MFRIGSILIALGIVAFLISACGKPATPDPVEIVSKIPFHGSISVPKGESVAFGAASIRSSSSTPVTKIKATLVPKDNANDATIQTYAIETESHNLPEVLVTKWSTAASALAGVEIPLDKYSLTSSAGMVNIVFKVRADRLGRSDWSQIRLTYNYEGNEYSQIIEGSLSLCAPDSLDCR